MDKPSNYSEETMKKVAARYQKEAETINASCTNNLTDSTVVYVSCPNPLRPELRAGTEDQ